MHSLHLKEVKAETLEFWRESNDCFAPPCNTVEEALETSDEWYNKVSKMIKI